MLPVFIVCFCYVGWEGWKELSLPGSNQLSACDVQKDKIKQRELITYLSKNITQTVKTTKWLEIAFCPLTPASASIEHFFTCSDGANLSIHSENGKMCFQVSIRKKLLIMCVRVYCAVGWGLKLKIGKIGGWMLDKREKEKICLINY